MRSEQELRVFLQQELAPELARWQARYDQRPPLLRGPRDWALCGLSLLALLWLHRFEALLLPVLVIGGRAVLEMGRLQRAFKQEVIARVVAFLEPGLSYQAGGSIPAETVRSSGLFHETFDACGGEDLVAGQVGATRLRFAEIRLTRRKKSGKHTRIEPVFRGLFLVADFPKSFRGRVLLLPDRAERVLGSFGRAFQRLPRFAGLELVELEDPDFERHFVCYGSDPVETRYLLSPSLISRLLRFRENTGAALRLALADESLFLALPLEHDLFAVKPGRPQLDEQALRTWAGELLFATGIVAELDLDTRIWSKPPPDGARRAG